MLQLTQHYHQQNFFFESTDIQQKQRSKICADEWQCPTRKCFNWCHPVINLLANRSRPVIQLAGLVKLICASSQTHWLRRSCTRHTCKPLLVIKRYINDNEKQAYKLPNKRLLNIIQQLCWSNNSSRQSNLIITNYSFFVLTSKMHRFITPIGLYIIMWRASIQPCWLKFAVKRDMVSVRKIISFFLIKTKVHPSWQNTILRCRYINCWQHQTLNNLNLSTVTRSTDFDVWTIDTYVSQVIYLAANYRPKTCKEMMALKGNEFHSKVAKPVLTPKLSTSVVGRWIELKRNEYIIFIE